MSLADLKNRNLSEIVALDIGATSVKAVKVRRAGSSFALLETDVLEAVDLSPASASRLVLDKKFHTAYAAICYSGRNTQVRYLEPAGKFMPGPAMEAKVRKLMGVGTELRIRHTVVRSDGAGGEPRLLGVAAPVDEIQRLRRILPDNKPNLLSVEVSGLAALHTFEHTDKAKQEGAASVYVEAGNQVTVMSFFLRGELVLVRKFEYGSRDLIERIRNLLDCDEDAALGVLYDDPAPLDASPEDPMGPFLKQMAIGRQFVENSEGVKIGAVYASGGLSYSPFWMSQIQECMEAPIEIWNPFLENGISSYPRGIKGVESMFAPALGAALAILRTP